jgi:hypothetical protein
LLIDTPAFAPITGTKNPDPAVAPAEAYGQDATIEFPKTEKARFIFTVPPIDGDDAPRVCEGMLCACKGNAMFCDILVFFPVTPFEMGTHTV